MGIHESDFFQGIVVRQDIRIRSRLTRRCLLGIGVAGITTAISAACAESASQGEYFMIKDSRQQGRAASQGRLLARPTQPTTAAPLGLQPLGLDSDHDGLLYIPPGYQAEKPAPLVLMLHGAGGNARQGLTPFLQLADAAGLILLAPQSRRQTWDVLFGRYGSDISFIDQALAQTFSRYAVNPAQIAIEGFSDGASYALSVGITNGDLFTHLIAFSPGFISPGRQQGSPRLFISHGTRDKVLPINACSRKIVPQVQRAGYDLLYQEFDGAHTVPPEIARSALAWFTPKRK